MLGLNDLHLPIPPLIPHLPPFLSGHMPERGPIHGVLMPYLRPPNPVLGVSSQAHLTSMPMPFTLQFDEMLKVLVHLTGLEKMIHLLDSDLMALLLDPERGLRKSPLEGEHFLRITKNRLSSLSQNTAGLGLLIPKFFQRLLESILGHLAFLPCLIGGVPEDDSIISPRLVPRFDGGPIRSFKVAFSANLTLFEALFRIWKQEVSMPGAIRFLVGGH